MKKLQIYALIAIALAVLAGTSAAANAQTTKIQNIQNNRDIRNTQLKRSSTSTQALMRNPVMANRPSPRSTATLTNIGPALPAWFRAPGSPWRNNKTIATSTRGLPPFLAKFATSTELKGHQTLKEIRLDKFAFLQSNLVAETEHALAKLKTSRSKIAQRIQTAEQNGRTMTDAKQLLTVADQKIADAEKAISALAAYVPPTIAAGTNVSATSSVSLTKPREVGRTAIEALKAAKEALRAVVVSIAKNMGLGTEERDERSERKNSSTTPPVATTTTATSTATSTNP